MGRRGKHLQQEVFGVVEIKAHGVPGRGFVAVGQQVMYLPVTRQPRRLKT
jgi:hypothetical protein